jgi:ubiquinone biosynthesis protein COQ4
MRDLLTNIALWIAQTINPPVQPERAIELDLSMLRQLPEGTLGREVARFLDENNFTPFNSGDLIQRTHDIWHVVADFSASEHDELKLQAFTRAQVFRPSSAVFVIYGLVVGKLHVSDVIRQIKRGRMAQRLVQWDVEADWSTPLDEVRRKLKIVQFEQDG